ncbi:MAG: flagellar basal-body rod protein FlgB [Myxococcota bacterium]|jgi:flagellar basal-body rod protein FlgB
MSLISDATNLSLQRAMDLRMQRQELLATNLANIDTPNYTPVDLAFEGALEAALESGDVNGRSAGMSLNNSGDGVVVERPDVHNTLDGNGVDLDREMARIVDNSAGYAGTLEIAKRRYSMIRQAITDMQRT